MEEFFLHLWDEYDDLVGVCRHVSASAMGELLDVAPRLASTSVALLVVVAAVLRLHPPSGG